MNNKFLFTERASEFLSQYLKENSESKSSAAVKLTPAAQQLILEVVDDSSLSPLVDGKWYKNLKFDISKSASDVTALLDSIPESEWNNDTCYIISEKDLEQYMPLIAAFRERESEEASYGYYMGVGSVLLFDTINIEGKPEFTPGWQEGEEPIKKYWDIETGELKWDNTNPHYLRLGNFTNTLNGIVFGQFSDPAAMYNLTSNLSHCSATYRVNGCNIAPGENVLPEAQILYWTITPESGYQITSILVNGEEKSAQSSINITGNINVVATAEPIPPTPTYDLSSSTINCNYSFYSNVGGSMTEINPGTGVLPEGCTFDYYRNSYSYSEPTVTINGNSYPSEMGYISNVSSNINFSAVSEQSIYYDLSCSETNCHVTFDNGAITPGSGVLLKGSDLNFWTSWDSSLYEEPVVRINGSSYATMGTVYDINSNINVTATAEPIGSQGLTFQSNGDGTCSVTGMGTCTDINLVIPSKSPAGDRVISIGDNAFSFKFNLQSIYIPATVENISNSSFRASANIQNITVSPASNYFKAVNKCLIDKRSNLIIFGQLTADFSAITGASGIGTYAFTQMNTYQRLSEIFIPDTFTTIAAYPFEYNNFTKINCQAESKPEGWDEEWNNAGMSSHYNVEWGYTPTTPD